MAVYLEVVPTNARLGPSGTHTLEGSQCLVFYLGGVPAPGTRHSGGVNILLGDGSVRFAKDLGAMVAELSRAPIGASTVIIGPASQSGYTTTRWQLAPGSKPLPSLGLTSAGGAAVLIGLLLPAVQAVREAASTRARHSAPIQQLKQLVGPAGHVFVLDSQGALLAV